MTAALAVALALSIVANILLAWMTIRFYRALRVVVPGLEDVTARMARLNADGRRQTKELHDLHREGDA